MVRSTKFVVCELAMTVPRAGSLNVHNITSPFPRSWKGKFHILFAHARQLHLTQYLLSSSAPKYDVYFVDQLSTCIPFLRLFAQKRVVFYGHFPDKLLANGEFIEGNEATLRGGPLKRLYRLPMDWLEEVTTSALIFLDIRPPLTSSVGQADVLLANSKFTARIFKTYFPSIRQTPKVVYPGINIAAYEAIPDFSDPDIAQVVSR
jgi:alpha-1,3/alpha-1,6-mannosyltransferase